MTGNLSGATLSQRSVITVATTIAVVVIVIIVNIFKSLPCARH